MAEWGQPLDYMLKTLTLPQMNLLSWARIERLKANRQWQMTVASLPLHEQPQDFYDEVMGLLDDEEGGDGSRGSSSNSHAPYLHEIGPFVAQSMGMPIQFVDVEA